MASSQQEMPTVWNLAPMRVRVNRRRIRIAAGESGVSGSTRVLAPTFSRKPGLSWPAGSTTPALITPLSAARPVGP